jgi:hypothetical protein
MKSADEEIYVNASGVDTPVQMTRVRTFDPRAEPKTLENPFLMKSLLVTIVCLLCFGCSFDASPSLAFLLTGNDESAGMKSVSEGDRAPDFSLSSQDGSQVSLQQYRGEWVVLYFYPKDFTQGCTIEAHGFQKDEAQYKLKEYNCVGRKPRFK